MGLLVKAKKEGFIPVVKPLLEKLKDTDFRISEEVIARTLDQAGEK